MYEFADVLRVRSTVAAHLLYDDSPCGRRGHRLVAADEYVCDFAVVDQ